jgi:glycosyltransferase involved in cell wall biosynthesis
LETPPDVKILVYVPTYNDRELVGELCTEALNLGGNYSVLVIDDGSDPPVEIDHHSPRLHAFRVPYNAGLGCATNIALDFAHRRGFDVLVRIDADGQHPPGSVPALVHALSEQRADVIVGNRLNNLKTGSPREIVASLLKRHVRFIANAATGLHVQDWHSGFMAFSKNAISALRKHPYERFPEVEILARSRVAGLGVREVPVLQRERSHGRSSLTLIPAMRHVLGVYAVLLRHMVREKGNG